MLYFQKKKFNTYHKSRQFILISLSCEIELKKKKKKIERFNLQSENMYGIDEDYIVKKLPDFNL